MLFRSRLRGRLRYYNTSGGPIPSALVQENGSFILTEDNFYILT